MHCCGQLVLLFSGEDESEDEAEDEMEARLEWHTRRLSVSVEQRRRSALVAVGSPRTITPGVRPGGPIQFWRVVPARLRSEENREGDVGNPRQRLKCGKRRVVNVVVP